MKPICFKSIPGLALLLVFTIISVSQTASAQTAVDIETVVRSCKWIDKSRPVKAEFDKDLGTTLITISTYCNPRATDQDCKINSLFIMKELVQHFKTVDRVRINFFYPTAPNRYRTVMVNKREVALIDGGKPVKELLTQISVSQGEIRRAGSNGKMGRNMAAASPAHPGASPSNWSNAIRGSQTPSQSASTNFKNFSTSDGDLTLFLPENWPTQDNPEPGIELRAGSTLMLLTVARHDAAIGSFENLVKISDLGLARYKGWRQIREETQSMNSQSGIYEEGVFDPDRKMRAFFLHGREHYYIFQWIYQVSNEREMESIYHKIFSSIHVRG